MGLKPFSGMAMTARPPEFVVFVTPTFKGLVTQAFFREFKNHIENGARR